MPVGAVNPDGSAKSKTHAEMVVETMQAWRKCGIEVVVIEQQSPTFRGVDGVMVPKIAWPAEGSGDDMDYGLAMPTLEGSGESAWESGILEFIQDPTNEYGMIAYIPKDPCQVPPGAKSGETHGWNAEFLASHYESLDARGRHKFRIVNDDTFKAHVEMRSAKIQEAVKIPDAEALAATNHVRELSEAMDNRDRGITPQKIQVVAPTGGVDVETLLNEIKTLKAEMVDLKSKNLRGGAKLPKSIVGEGEVASVEDVVTGA